MPSTWEPTRLTGRGADLTLPSMIRPLSDIAPGVLGLGVVDDIEKEDYENVFVPAVEAAIAEHGKVRLVYVLGHEYEAEAAGRTSSVGSRRLDERAEGKRLTTFAEAETPDSSRQD